MKKLLILILALMMCAMALLSCEVETVSSSSSSSNQSSEESSSREEQSSSSREEQSSSTESSSSEESSSSSSSQEPQGPQFTFSASSDCIIENDKVTFAINEGATIGSFDPIDVELVIVETNVQTHILHNGTDSEFTPKGIGKTTLKMVIKGVESSNTVTVYSLANPTNLLLGITRGLLKSSLGVPFSIGIEPEHAQFYEIIGGGDIVKYNSDGTITFDGIVEAECSIKIKCKATGSEIPTRVTSYTTRGIAKAVRNYLVSKGTVTEAQAIPMSLAVTVPELDFTDCSIKSADELAILSRFESLKILNVADQEIDLSKLSENCQLKELYFTNNAGDDLDTSAIGGLEKLSLVGSLTVIVKEEARSAVISAVKNNGLKLSVFEDEWLDATNVDDFFATVFFGDTELANHLSSNSGYIVPKGSYKHAILVNASGTKQVKAKNLETLELYNTTLKKSLVSENNSLTLCLYDSKIAPDSIGVGIHTGLGTLRLYVYRGDCVVKGTDGETTVSGTSKSHEQPKVGIVSANVVLQCFGEATLTVKGGNGWNGWDGTDGSALSSSENTMENKKGQTGGMGATAIHCQTIAFLSGGVKLYGGNGGAGGDGGDGDTTNIFNHGYNGGHAGNGGAGAAAVEYSNNYQNVFEAKTEFHGGTGGAGGTGGEGKGTSSDGDDGESGSSGTNGAKRVDSFNY